MHVYVYIYVYTPKAYVRIFMNMYAYTFISIPSYNCAHTYDVYRFIIIYSNFQYNHTISPKIATYGQVLACATAVGNVAAAFTFLPVHHTSSAPGNTICMYVCVCVFSEYVYICVRVSKPHLFLVIFVDVCVCMRMYFQYVCVCV